MNSLNKTEYNDTERGPLAEGIPKNKRIWMHREREKMNIEIMFSPAASEIAEKSTILLSMEYFFYFQKTIFICEEQKVPSYSLTFLFREIIHGAHAIVPPELFWSFIKTHSNAHIHRHSVTIIF